LRNFGLVGAKIEGAGIPSGATIVTVNISSLVLSVAATASNSSVQIRIFPHGNGDGATTFNIPDDRDRVSVGRGGMGGTLASRILTTGAGAPGVDTSKLGVGGGVDRHTVTSAQMPVHTHVATSVVTDPGHTHDIDTVGAIPFGSAGALIEAFAVLGASSSPASRVTLTSETDATVATTNDNTGGGEAHPNLQPSRVVNKIIFTGVA
jgi:microcystin-dependent protein